MPQTVSILPQFTPGRGCWVDLIPSGGAGGGVEASAAAVRRFRPGLCGGKGSCKRGAALLGGAANG
jgi:hypothetical protein